jgi:phosphoglycolate phosphatase
MVKILVHGRQPTTQEAQENIEFDAKAFIFDKDGTLITHDHFVPIMEKRVELLAEKYQLSHPDQDQLTRIFGLDPKTREIIPHGTMFIARVDTQILVEAFLREHGFYGKEARNVVTEIFEKADFEVELEKYIRPIPGVKELLEKLKNKNVSIAIATHDSTVAAERQLNIANLNQYMDLIIGLDYNDDILHKPSPSMLLTACKKFDISPTEVVVLGDSVNDVLMGIRGGAGLSLAVLSGEHEMGDFKEYDAILDSVAMLEILD